MMFTLAREKAESGTDREVLFEQLVRKSYRQAYALACRLTGNSAEAEDLVQESFVRAYRFFHRYDRALPFTSWLYRIMGNANIDRARRKSRIKTMSIDQAGVDGTSRWDMPDTAAGPDRQVLALALDGPIQKGLMTLNSEFRTAVLLADVEGLGYDEIAEVMHTSVGTVRSRIHRGRRQLRSYLVKHSPQTYGSLCDEL